MNAYIQRLDKNELCEHSKNVILTALSRNELSSGNFCGCAVGHLIAAAMNYKFREDIPIWTHISYDETGEVNYNRFLNKEQLWTTVFCTGHKDGKLVHHFNPDHLRANLALEFSSTGYSIHELRRIEAVYEITFSSTHWESASEIAAKAVITELENIRDGISSGIETVIKGIESYKANPFLPFREVQLQNFEISIDEIERKIDAMDYKDARKEEENIIDNVDFSSDNNLSEHPSVSMVIDRNGSLQPPVRGRKSILSMLSRLCSSTISIMGI